MFKLDLEKAEEPDIKLPWFDDKFDHWKSKKVPEKYQLLVFDYAKAFDCVDYHKLENSERDRNTRPPDLPLEKPICRSGSKLELDMEQQTCSK